MRFFRNVSIALIAALAFNGVTAAASGPSVKLPDYQTLTLDNGATVLLMPRKDVPLVAANIAVRGGALADAIGKEGTADLLGEMLSKGAGNRSALQFAQTVDPVDACLGQLVSRHIELTLDLLLRADAELALHLTPLVVELA